MAVALVVAWGMPGWAATGGGVPRFEAFAVGGRLGSRVSRVRIEDARGRRYKAVLLETVGRRSDFAGHYVLASWGCGASCTMSAAVDALTGRVTWLPFTVCCWAATRAGPLDFRLGSRLLVVHGSRDESGGGTYYYRFDGNGFALLRAAEDRAGSAR